MNKSPENKSSNPFLQATLSSVLSYVNPDFNSNIKITMFSDSAYHSQTDSYIKDEDHPLKFRYHNQPISKVPKTGLGSSAGLVTTVTTALLSFYKPDLDPTDKNWLSIIHNLSQFAHCLSQKKIGSGFDVAAAVYGSIVYSRFPQSTLSTIIDLIDSNDTTNKKTLISKQIQETINSKWEMSVKPCSLPKGLRILMGDVKGGSETPKLVNNVLKWKKENPEQSLKLWNNLNNENIKLVEILNQLSNLNKNDEESYNEILSFLSENNSGQINLFTECFNNNNSNNDKFTKNLSILTNCINTIKKIRFYLRRMTIESKTEIEPNEQTILLNSCLFLSGVLGGVVPGAGGNDAISIIIHENNVEKIKKLTNINDELFIGKKFPNQGFFKNVEWLDLREEQIGLKEVLVDDYLNIL